jgi:hypothetical protein
MLGPLEVWAAFSIGLLGSIHCVGMCGPLALAVPYQGEGRFAAAKGVLAYTLGRLATYAIIGSMIGIAGKGFLVAGIQKYLTLAIGISIAFIAIFSIAVESYFARIPPVRRFNLWTNRQLGGWIGRKGTVAALMIGVFNGLIPCGLVYMAIAGAVTVGNILSGATFMVLFGLGTVPLMAFTGLAGQSLNPALRGRLRRFAPALMLLVAALFLLRGLQFEVPGALRFWEEARNIPMCH